MDEFHPVIYAVLTLSIAASRMAANIQVSWATRRNRTAVTDPTNACGWEICSFKKDTGSAARTVTIISLHDPSPVGSTDSIDMGFGDVKAETKVEVTIEQAQESDGESPKR